MEERGGTSHEAQIYLDCRANTNKTAFIESLSTQTSAMFDSADYRPCDLDICDRCLALHNIDTGNVTLRMICVPIASRHRILNHGTSLDRMSTYRRVPTRRAVSNGGPPRNASYGWAQLQWKSNHLDVALPRGEVQHWEP